MGNVYRVFDDSIKEEIALKVIHPAIAADEETKERFKNELKLARKITHKNVCRMYDFYEESNTAFITMEYIPGENLKSMMTMMGRLSVGKAASIAGQICEGLIEAHKLGIVHRDLKPRNILIDKNGDVRILDFGIARSLQAEGLTGDGIIIGTAEYISPEQVKGEKPDPRSDIYSLGVILYEMLTGELPFQGDNSLSIALKHKTEKPPDPRKTYPDIPLEFSRIILKCLEKDKTKRYQSAKDLMDELGKWDEKTAAVEKSFLMSRVSRRGTKSGSQRFFIRPAIALILLGILLVLSAIFTLIVLYPGGQSRWKASVAVLPFEDRSLLKDQQDICEGMTLDIINKLSLVEGLKVPPELSVRRYAEEADFKKMSRDLDVETILVSYVNKEADKIHISAQLIDTDDNYVIRSFDYEEAFENIYDLQDKLIHDLSGVLHVRFAEERLKAYKKKEPRDPEAYTFYVRGRHFERRYNEFENESDFTSAVENYKKAVAIEENFALAYWGLGNVYQTRFVITDMWKDFETMVTYYRKTYEINPGLPEANIGLGWAHFYQGEWDQASSYYKKALQSESANPEIRFHAAGFLKDIGLYKKAIKLYSGAIEIDPASSIYRQLCAYCWMKIGEFEKAAAQLKEALIFDPDNLRTHLFYARQFIMMKKYKEAEKILTRLEETDPDLPDIRYTRAYILAASGEREEALNIIKGLDPYLYSHLLSSVYAALGMKDEAIENIQKVIKNGFLEIKTYPYHYPALLHNHFYDNLRGDNRFEEILRKEKDKYEKRLKKYHDLFDSF
ncbi:MAG: protein kinase [Candidatus Aminicenantes bacterium]|nr:protein kinase [Candidatus Aminicenantes bacterium]